MTAPALYECCRTTVTIVSLSQASYGQQLVTAAHQLQPKSTLSQEVLGNNKEPAIVTQMNLDAMQLPSTL